MSRSYPSYVSCAPPGVAHAFLTGGNIIGLLFYSALLGTAFGVMFGSIISEAVSNAIHAGCIAGPIVAATLFFGLDYFRRWYSDYRLMCIDSDRCIIGTLADDPQVSSFDGDRKMDMLLAPFIFRDELSVDPAALDTLNCKDYFVAEIQAHPELFGPGPTNIAETSQLMSYIDGLDDSAKVALYMRVVHERMFHSSVPERHFQRHFLVKDKNQMPPNAFNEAPDDSFGSPDPNPLFRFDYRPPPAPFLHCELEGNKWEKILTNLQVALLVAFLAFLAVCAICLAYQLPEPACSLIGAGIALLLALLAWWIMNQVNDPNDGAADQSDLDFEDPAYDGDQMTIVPGDALLVYGDWIMDTEHGNYFELHPIKAIYLICNAVGMGDAPWDLVDDLSNDYPRRERCPYPMERVTAEDLAAMCGLVDDAEKGDPVILMQVPDKHALSMVAGFR